MPFFRLRRTLLLAAVSTMLLPLLSASAQAPNEPRKPSLLDRVLGIKQDQSGGWLFVGSRKTGETGIYMAISKDGYNWAYVADGKAITRHSERDELMLDPFIVRAPDGIFRMVWTWSASSPAIGYSTSTDLVHWSKNRKLVLAANIPGASTANSPSIYYRESAKDWLILWSSRVAAPGASPADRIYFTTTANFKTFAPAKIFFDPGYDVTDANLLGSGMPGLFYLIFTDERTSPLQKRIYAAEGPSMIGPWQKTSASITASWTEAPIQVADGLLLYYHRALNPQDPTSHGDQGYGAAFTKDMTHWADDSLHIAFPGGIYHGSFLHITTDEYSFLHNYYIRYDAGLAK
jgi:hypothetical protein